LCQRFLSSSAVNVSGEKSATDSDHSAKDVMLRGGGGGEQDQKSYARKPVRGGVCIPTYIYTYTYTHTQLLLLAMWFLFLGHY